MTSKDNSKVDVWTSEDGWIEDAKYLGLKKHRCNITQFVLVVFSLVLAAP